jgi:hypothetical protein
MPEDNDEHAGRGERDYYHEPDEFDELDDFDDEEGPGPAWPAPGYPPGAPGEPPRGWPRAPGARASEARASEGGGGGRGWLLTLTAVVAAALGFGVVVVALHETTPNPVAASAAPSSTPSSGTGNGTQLAPPGGGGLRPLPSGATERLEIGGPVTAVSPTSITLDGGGQAVTATVTSATRVTGKVTSIRGIKVGDLVSALITGSNGKLTAESIQDPASLPSGSGQ